MGGMDAPKCIVLTGGPGGGKSTLMRELRSEDPDAKQWLMLPEIAPIVFTTGMDARCKTFQRAVVRFQLAFEEVCTKAATAGQVVLCHRGTLDALAYWLSQGWIEEEFFSMSGMDRREHFDRYAGVLHMQTTAINAKEHYLRWPDARRCESPEDAAEIDELCSIAWAGHPRYSIIENQCGGWEQKSKLAHAFLGDLLCVDCD